MSEATVPVTGGSGHNIHAWDRTISATLVKDQFFLPGEYPYAAYNITADAISIATANDHVIQIMAGSSTYVRVRRIRIEQVSSAAAAGGKGFEIRRLTTAGTGGSAVTPAKFDNGDSAASCTAMTLPSAKGTEGALVMNTFLIVRQAVGTTTAQVDDDWTWVQQLNQKPIIVPAGTSNGIAVKIVSASASATVNVNIEVVETAWLGA